MMLLFVLLVLTFFVYLVKLTKKPPNFPPGPLFLPFVGNLPELKKLSRALGGQHLALEAIAKKHNTNVLGLKLGNEYVVTVFTYPIVKQVLTSEEFEGRPDNFFLRLRCLGKRNGITCTDGQVWNTQRNFVNRHLRSLGFGKSEMEKMIEDEVVEILKILENENDISIDKLLAPSVINVIWHLVTGHHLSRDNKQLKELLELFGLRAKAFDMTGGTLSQHPWLRHVCPELSGYNLIQSVNSRMKDLFSKVITEHLESWTDGKNGDLIYRYISEMKADGKNFTEEQLVMICLDLFIAGAQTTSRTLDFAFLMMVTHPEVQDKVRKQIRENFSDAEFIKYSDRYKVPYVDAVLLETMRLRHVTPIIGPRRVLKQTVIGGYTLPKDTTVLISMHSIHNNSDYWKNPEMFTPDRFLDEQDLLIKSEKLLPFGLGKRRCLGEALAKNCIFSFFTEILKNYKVTLPPGCEPPKRKYLPGITISPEPYKVRFVKNL